jgi:hypothetical protein
MAASAGVLIQALIDGGVSASAAKVIASALANAATPTLSQSRDVSDATPADALRMIDADGRRYRFTNLDYSAEAPYEARLRANVGRYEANDADHPYKDAQPVTPVPPLSQAATTGGSYIDVQNTVQDGAPLATVNLKIGANSGSHLRINRATNAVDAVPLEFVSPQGFVTGTVSDKSQSTQIELAVRQLQSRTVITSDGSTAGIWGWINGAVASTTAISNWMLTNFLSLTSASAARTALGVAAYSTGTWTPAITCTTTAPTGVTYTVNSGDWVRVGEWVYVTGRALLSALSTAGSGNVVISGLPFVVAIASEFAAGPVAWRGGFGAAPPDAVMTIQGATHLYLTTFANGNAVAFVTAANLTASSDVIFSCLYKTSAA